MKEKFLLAPSLLSADFSKLGRELEFIQKNGGDWIHIDVMDGSFVPNLTFGVPVIKCLRNKTDLPFDVHLMVNRPQDFIDDFAKAGANYFTFHQEAAIHAHRLTASIHDAGMKAGISICPSTPVSVLSELLPFVDLILIMTVNPGFGGQKMIPECLKKATLLAACRKEHSYRYLISVDGGINAANIQDAIGTGADIIVSGSSFFSGDIKK